MFLTATCIAFQTGHHEHGCQCRRYLLGLRMSASEGVHSVFDVFKYMQQPIAYPDASVDKLISNPLC